MKNNFGNAVLPNKTLLYARFIRKISFISYKTTLLF